VVQPSPGGRVSAEADLGLEGVVLTMPPTFTDDRGTVMRMVRRTDRHFQGFGEIYFSSVLPGVVKAWKKHRSLVAIYACMSGRVRMVLYDARPDSHSFGEVREVDMGPEDYLVLVVPPGIWNGFMGLGDRESVVANCASEPYDPAEFERLEPDTPSIPYRWSTPLPDSGRTDRA
jgi:dTDP-4-dehydrorhamnose 3,5-epimerase